MRLMDLSSFYNIHKGKTALLVGNGPNLYKTPPEWFDYISFGMNTIYKYPGWRPTYYVGCDFSLFENHGAEVNAAFPDILKFVPTPTLDAMKGENYVRFNRRPGLFVGGHLANERDALYFGLCYTNVMTCAMQLAWHMGFTTLLLIGVEQKPAPGMLADHFWGKDPNFTPSQDDYHWNKEYAQLVHAMTGVKVLNISEGTYVPESVLPRDDWQKWRNVEQHYGGQVEPELRHDDEIYFMPEAQPEPTPEPEPVMHTKKRRRK